jgi:hypothetical protein
MMRAESEDGQQGTLNDVAERKQNRRELAFWAIFIVGIIALAIFVWHWLRRRPGPALVVIKLARDEERIR